jgi:hypothetical protein
VSSNVHTALSRNDWHLHLVHDLPSQALQGDPSIDDPVNDTGSALGTAICKFRGVCFLANPNLKYEKLS